MIAIYLLLLLFPFKFSRNDILRLIRSKDENPVTNVIVSTNLHNYQTMETSGDDYQEALLFFTSSDRYRSKGFVIDWEVQTPTTTKKPGKG